MTTGEWSCLISFTLAPLTCSEREGSEKFKLKIYVLGVLQYIDISVYRNTLRIYIVSQYEIHIAIHRDFFFLLIKLFIFHSILVLYQLQVQKMHAWHMNTLIKKSSHSHLCMYIILIPLPRLRKIQNIEKLI